MKTFQEITYSDITQLEGFQTHSSGRNSVSIGGWKLYWILSRGSIRFTEVDLYDEPTISIQEVYKEARKRLRTVYIGHIEQAGTLELEARQLLDLHNYDRSRS